MAEPLSDLTAKCIKCGFCLEACPTFVLTGDESRSPRGRINLARAADEGQIEWTETADAMDTCLGCRACETACPSGVHYGMILELARHELRKERPRRAEAALINTITIFLGMSVGATATAENFLRVETLAILLLGVSAFAIGTGAGACQLVGINE